MDRVERGIQAHCFFFSSILHFAFCVISENEPESASQSASQSAR